MRIPQPQKAPDQVPVPTPAAETKSKPSEFKLVIVDNVPKAEAFEFEGRYMSTNELLVWIANKLLEFE